MIEISPNTKACLLGVGIFCFLIPWVFPLILGPNPNILVQLIAICSVTVIYLLPVSKFQVISFGLILAAAINALIGILQYFFLADIFHPYILQKGVGEAYGMLGQRNHLASLTTLGYISILIGYETKLFVNRTLKNAALIILLLLAIGNAVSLSRTGLIQWIVVLLIQIKLARGWRSEGVALALTASVTYALAVLFIPYLLTLLLGQDFFGLLSRFGSEGACDSRRNIWSNVVDLIAIQPLSGWGWGGLKYAHFTTLFSNNRFCGVLGNAHNLILHLAVELGIPFALLITSLIVWVIMSQRPWIEIVPEKKMAWWALFVIGIHSMVEYPLWYGPFQMIAIMYIFLLAGWNGVSEEMKQLRTGLLCSKRHLSTLVGVVAVFMFLGYAVWDYLRISKMYQTEYMQTLKTRESTIQEARRSILFRQYVDFGELTVMQLRADNAQYINDLSRRVLHFSPEPKVIKLIVESAWLLNNMAQVEYFLPRFEAAFPQEYLGWIKVRSDIYTSLDPKKSGSIK